MTLYLGNNLISGTQTLVGESRNIGQMIPSAIPLTDAGLHLIDGSLILGSGIYSAFVDKIAGLTTNYPDLFVTEADWQTSVSTYGVCGKFVYTNEISATMPSLGTLTGTRNSSSDMDAGSLGMRYAWYVPELRGDIFTVSETPSVGDGIWVYQNGSWINSGVSIETFNRSVRLPKITGILEGTTDATALGDLVEQFVRLPNITGTFAPYIGGDHSGIAWDNTSYQLSGAFYRTSIGNGKTSTETDGSYGRAGLGLDASRSSSVYSGNGTDTVIQPQTIKCYYYIVIATSTKTDIQVDIDEIATDLNGKADTDLSNMSASQSAKNEIISWGMPDYTAGIDLSSYTSSSNQFTAPCDGVVNWGHVTTSKGYLNNVIVNSWASGTVYAYSNMFLPLHKGDKWYADVYNDTSTICNKFFPLKGAN